MDLFAYGKKPRLTLESADLEWG